MTEVEVKDIDMIANILVSDLPPDSWKTIIDPPRVVWNHAIILPTVPIS